MKIKINLYRIFIDNAGRFLYNQGKNMQHVNNDTFKNLAFTIAALTNKDQIKVEIDINSAMIDIPFTFKQRIGVFLNIWENNVKYYQLAAEDEINFKNIPTILDKNSLEMFHQSYIELLEETEPQDQKVFDWLTAIMDHNNVPKSKMSVLYDENNVILKLNHYQ